MEAKYLVTAVLTMLVVLSAAEECNKSDTCVCKTSSGRTVDLRALSDRSFTVQDDTKVEKTMYYFSPCKKLSQQGCDLTGDVAVCQEVLEPKKSYFDAGDLSTQDFSGDLAGTLNLTFKSGKRTSLVTLLCSANERLEFETESPIDTYNFRLYQPYVCLGGDESGLSTGSVLVIIFFVLFIVYWVAGFIFMKFVRHAEGLEMIPNYEFWKELPLLIRDGVTFTLRGCKGETTYEKI